MAAVPPGWYADASKPGFERWWDGGSWSEVTRPTPLPTAQPERAPVGRSTPDGVPVANPWRRLGAVILDYLLIGIVVGTLGAPLVRDLSDKLNALLDQVQAATAAGQPPPDVTTFWSDN